MKAIEREAIGKPDAGNPPVRFDEGGGCVSPLLYCYFPLFFLVLTSPRICQMIETSSITGHFVDQNGDAYIDIFSCKPFSQETAMKVVQKFFNPKKIKPVYLTRQA
jgi:hypothetical protein